MVFCYDIGARKIKIGKPPGKQQVSTAYTIPVFMMAISIIHAVFACIQMMDTAEREEKFYCTAPIFHFNPY
ncbi:hypothetical protein CD32_21940 [Lysinibacillus odysseyi 34hs-1 = NBRC 100172]|uniref:Uncharacterized protein n=1 Tax=Lysinibacillus odysseyi 34hs-1 = NBRC 100172 TaxID=1220589 RepID=A0A0A3IGL2_9BACI|nr:hypothetical protein CD32_21940 [Lysinibacillus odysseyi 34hs-1 = NBRC 100172]